MSRRSLALSLKFSLTLTSLFLVFTVLWLNSARQPVLAQADGTAVPYTTLNEPTLVPASGSSQFPSGWLKIAGKSPQIIYLTANGTTSDGIGGAWQPELPQAGSYRVEVYVGVNEFREYALLFPEQLAGLERLTHSAQYVINAAGGQITAVIDQDMRESGWVDLGVYDFTGASGEGVTLGNVTDEVVGTAVLALSGARFTRVGDNSAATETAVTSSETPQPTDTSTATAVPSATPTIAATTSDGPLELLGFGEQEFISSDSSERDEVEIPLIIDGDPVGRMAISYPANMDSTEADNINVNIFVEDAFADALKVALEDETANEILGAVIVRSQFFLTLDAASFEFDDTFKTQRLTVFQSQPAGVAWNIKPKEGVRGQQEFNIKVILRFTDGVPEVSGPPPTFSINVLGNAGPGDVGIVTLTPTSGGRIIDNLIDNTAVLIGACLSFIVGILGVLIAYLNYRKGKDSPPSPDAPSVLDGERQQLLHRWLDDYFNDQELRSLCLEIGVDYDDLPFSGQSAKARELVGWCARNGRLDTLETTIRQHRPNLPVD